MRNLKKLVSLLLVVAMIASLCVAGIFTASAAGEIDNSMYYDDEALQIDMLTKTGVFQGYGDGTYGWDQLVKRSEAATLIARAMLGVKLAGQLTTTETPFTDVPAWATGAVGYLYKNGVVNGKSETTFDPNGYVTSVEFAKMMLAAMGYGKQGEYTGASWDVNTLVDAIDLGLMDDGAADLTAPATRANCRQYLFNAIIDKDALVTWDARLNCYTPVTKLPNGYKTFASRVGITIGETSDEFGRPCDTYDYAKQSYVVARYPDWTDTALNSSILYSHFAWLGNPAYAAEALSANPITLYVDGQVSYPTLNQVYKGETGENASYTGRGAHVEYYGIGGIASTTATYVRWNEVREADPLAIANSLTVVVYYEHAAKVTKVYTDPNGIRHITLDDGTVIDDTDLNAKKDDYVIYTQGKGKPRALSVAEIKSGSYTKYTTSSNERGYVIDGKTYYANETVKDEIEDILINGGKPDVGVYDFVLDTQGNIVAIDLVNELYQDYIYVTNVSVEPTNNNRFSGTTGGVAVDVVYTDGSGTDVLYFDTWYNGNGYETTVLGKTIDLSKSKSAIEAAVKAAGLEANNWYSYSLDRSGYVELAELNGRYESAVSETEVSGDTRFSTKIGSKTLRADADTVLRVIDKKGNVSKRTGYTRFIDAEGDIMITYPRDLSGITTIYVYKTDDAANVDAFAYLAEIVDAGAKEAHYIFLRTDGTTLDTTVSYSVIDVNDMEVGHLYEVTSQGGKVVAIEEEPDTKVAYGSVEWWNTELDEHFDHDVAQRRPAAAYTIGTLDSKFVGFETSDTEIYYDADGKQKTKTVDTYSFDFDKSAILVDVTGSGLDEIEDLEEGMGFIAEVDENDDILIIWVVYNPNAPVEGE